MFGLPGFNFGRRAGLHLKWAVEPIMERAPAQRTTPPSLTTLAGRAVLLTEMPDAVLEKLAALALEGAVVRFEPLPHADEDCVAVRFIYEVGGADITIDYHDIESTFFEQSPRLAALGAWQELANAIEKGENALISVGGREDMVIECASGTVTFRSAEGPGVMQLRLPYARCADAIRAAADYIRLKFYGM